MLQGEALYTLVLAGPEGLTLAAILGAYSPLGDQVAVAKAYIRRWGGQTAG